MMVIYYRNTSNSIMVTYKSYTIADSQIITIAVMVKDMWNKVWKPINHTAMGFHLLYNKYEVSCQLCWILPQVLHHPAWSFYECNILTFRNKIYWSNLVLKLSFCFTLPLQSESEVTEIHTKQHQINNNSTENLIMKGTQINNKHTIKQPISDR